MLNIDRVIEQKKAATRKRLQAYQQTTLEGAAIEASIAKANKQAVAQLRALTLCAVSQNPSWFCVGACAAFPFPSLADINRIMNYGTA
jgi:hypothetical protein